MPKLCLALFCAVTLAACAGQPSTYRLVDQRAERSPFPDSLRVSAVWTGLSIAPRSRSGAKPGGGGTSQRARPVQIAAAD